MPVIIKLKNEYKRTGKTNVERVEKRGARKVRGGERRQERERTGQSSRKTKSKSEREAE